MSTVATRLAEVRDRINRACEAAERDPSEVTIVAVSKRQPDERLLEAYAAGHRDFGENFVQELERKRALLPDDARWHQLGHIQTNKAKKAALADLVHTLDSARLGRALNRAASGAGRTVITLVEVNLAGEPQKAGLSPSDIEDLVRTSEAWPALEIRGLMCIPPAGRNVRWFLELAALRDRLQNSIGHPLPELSMGMSDDFEAAIEAGATLVRIGTAIFGPRE